MFKTIALIAALATPAAALAATALAPGENTKLPPERLAEIATGL